MADEYIRKQDVLNLPKTKVRNFKGEVIEESIDIDDVNELEPADVVQVRHARWERYSGITIRCSWCEHVVHDWRLSECKYCPNCGAKMDGEECGHVV